MAQPQTPGAQTDPRPRPAPSGDVAVPDRPGLAPGVDLTGEMPDSAYDKAQWLIQRDGRFVQVTELLYRVAEQIDGERTIDEIAGAVSRAIGRNVSADNVRHLLVTKLIPAGLVATADGTALSPATAGGEAGPRSPLQLAMRVRVLDPRFINPFTAVLRHLFWPPVLVAILVVAALAQAWLFGIHGIAGSVHDALYHPALMLALLGLIVVGTVWHEFGHASALRYGGGQVRGMGVGIYLVYPAFYMDVTDNYRLPRWSKVRTDLGGFYFNLIFAMVLFACSFVFGQQFLLA
ncbi:MAG: site-2 protease family protein, partial [Chloroflexi bacterium]|nr:site-2 protease family protein [Chloroflexota bacterium]